MTSMLKNNAEVIQEDSFIDANSDKSNKDDGSNDDPFERSVEENGLNDINLKDESFMIKSHADRHQGTNGYSIETEKIYSKNGKKKSKAENESTGKKFKKFKDAQSDLTNDKDINFCVYRQNSATVVGKSVI